MKTKINFRPDVFTQSILNNMKNLPKDIKKDSTKQVQIVMDIFKARVKTPYLISHVGQYGLKRRTGRLRKSVKTHVFKKSQNITRGELFIEGSANKYAGFHEFGWNGLQKVLTHNRRHDHVFNIKLLDKPIVRVSSYTRRVNYNGRPFVLPALIDVLPKIRDTLLFNFTNLIIKG